MGSERNPELASILWALKNPSEAGKEQKATPKSVEHAIPDSTPPASKRPSQIDGSLAATDRRRRPAQPSTDPSKITTWAPAQKYVIENIYSNQGQTSRIKLLINNQQGQEKQWWAEREALISKHRARSEKEKEVAAMLQSMGGIASSIKPSNTGEEDAELRSCDLKIHRAMTKLATDIDRELRSMGVPFYAIKHELVVMERHKDGSDQLGKIEKAELRALQKRMLQLLEELFKE